MKITKDFNLKWNKFKHDKRAFISFIPLLFGTIRLARFNLLEEETPRPFFIGLTTPLNALILFGYMLFSHRIYGNFGDPRIAILLVVIMGLLMVSNIRYHSFKEFEPKNRIPFMAFLIIVPIFVLIAIKPALVLFLLAMSYIISGPIFTLILLHRHRAARKDAR